MNNYIELQTKLQLSKNSNMKCIRDDEIDEISKVSIDTNLPKVERIISFIEKVKNPYVFMVDGMKVKMEFTTAGKTINECFETLIMNRKNI